MAMIEALRMAQDVMKVVDCQVHAQHISASDNVVADNLSRGRAGDALKMATDYFGFEGTPIVCGTMFERFVQAAYRGADKHAPAAK